MWRAKKWGAIVLLAACVAAWYFGLVPRVALDRATPRVQNGLRLKALYLRADGATRYVDAYVERLAHGGAEPLEFSIVEFPQNQKLFVESFPHPTRHPDAWRVGVWLNQPPSVRRLTLEARSGDRVARWGLILPRSVHAVPPQETYDEWVLHPELQARLGVDAEVDSKGGVLLHAGIRECRLHTREPYEWGFTVQEVIPEWLTSTLGGQSPRQLAVDAQRQSGKSEILFQRGFTETKDSSESLTLAIALMHLPYADAYRACRVVGRLVKYERREESIDLTGVPVEIHRDAGGNPYLLPQRDWEWTTPSGVRVRWLRQSLRVSPRYEQGFIGGVLRVENPTPPAAAFHNAQKRQPPSPFSLLVEDRGSYRIEPIIQAGKPDLTVWIYARLDRNGSLRRLPPMRVRFVQRTPVGKPIEFDRALPVRVVRHSR